jgi:hypothetical protein
MCKDDEVIAIVCLVCLAVALFICGNAMEEIARLNALGTQVAVVETNTGEKSRVFYPVFLKRY